MQPQPQHVATILLLTMTERTYLVSLSLTDQQPPESVLQIVWFPQ